MAAHRPLMDELQPLIRKPSALRGQLQQTAAAHHDNTKQRQDFITNSPLACRFKGSTFKGTKLELKAVFFNALLINKLVNGLKHLKNYFILFFGLFSRRKTKVYVFVGMTACVAFYLFILSYLVEGCGGRGGGGDYRFVFGFYA